MCSAVNGEATVHVKRKEGELCVLDFIPDSYLAKLTSQSSFVSSIYEETLMNSDIESAAVISHGGHKYVTKSMFKRKCNMVEDI